MVLIHVHLARLTLVDAPPPYELHQRLWRTFDAEARVFLHRADRAASASRSLVVLVQSTRPGDWSRLGDKLASVDCKEREIRLEEGDVFRFFLRANPTVARKGRREPRHAALEGEEFQRARGRRVAIVSDESRAQWLHRKADMHGFSILETAGGGQALRISNARTTSWARRGNMARHDGVDFEGLLRIRDPEELSRAVTQGIGSAKAFGFGLLSLARP